MTATQKPTSPDLGIKRLSIPEAVAESLQQRILSGEFKEGDALVQEALANEYKVSRMPIREALRQLEATGLVAMQMHKGAVVTSLPLEQIGELFDLRELLEGELLARSLPNMTGAQLGESRALLTQLEQAYIDGAVSRWGELNWAFHRSLYLASGRVQTLALAQTVNIQTDRYIRLQLLLTNALEGAEVEHRELLRLCEAREVKAAVAYLKRHIREAGANLARVLSKARAPDAA
ncbi:MAG TPA: GntR family transcriptional regulator [Caulobacteraceae bacterium]